MEDAYEAENHNGINSPEPVGAIECEPTITQTRVDVEDAVSWDNHFKRKTKKKLLSKLWNTSPL
jgi:hypothetical protein